MAVRKDVLMQGFLAQLGKEKVKFVDDKYGYEVSQEVNNALSWHYY